MEKIGYRVALSSFVCTFCAHINDGHVPDIIRHSHPPTCYEFKCYTPHASDGALGNGSKKCGGAASTTDGHIFAFGNTEERLRWEVLGVKERGTEADGPFDRLEGHGWVKQHDGDYADAISKKHGAILLGSESTGALFTPLV